jgi:hypothetical protein
MRSWSASSGVIHLSPSTKLSAHGSDHRLDLQRLITAVNTGGNESFCSEIASAIARDDSTGIATGQDASATGFVTTPTDQSVHGSVATPTVQDHTIISSAPAPTVEDHSAINPPQQANPVTAPTH